MRDKLYRQLANWEFYPAGRLSGNAAECRVTSRVYYVSLAAVSPSFVFDHHIAHLGGADADVQETAMARSNSPLITVECACIAWLFLYANEADEMHMISRQAAHCTSHRLESEHEG